MFGARFAVVLVLVGCGAPPAVKSPAPREVAPPVEPAVTSILPGWDEGPTSVLWGVHREITHDQRFVLVLTDVQFEHGSYNDANGTLLAVPLAGGPPIRLAEHVNQDFGLTRDGTRVLLRRHDGDHLAFEAVPVAGGPAVRLGTDVAAYWIPPDGQQLVTETYNRHDATLHLISLDGREERELADKVEDVGGLTADGRTMLFETDRKGASCTLHAVALAGGPSRLLARNVYPAIDWTRDGSRVLVLLDYTRASESGTLASVPIEGGTPVVLATRVRELERTADDRRVVFTAMAEGAAAEARPIRLASVPIDGGPVHELSSNLAIDDYKITRDDRAVVYVGHAPTSLDIAGRGSLAIADLDGGAPRILSTEVHRPVFGLTTDGQRALFYTAYDGARSSSLASVRLADGAVTALGAGIDDRLAFDSMLKAGARILVSRGPSISVVSVADGAAATFGPASSAALAPDASQIAFIDHPDEHGIGTLTIASSAGGSPHAVLRHCGGLSWIDAHHLLAVRRYLDGPGDPQPTGLYVVQLP
jgi:hypothetical protein